MKKTNKKMTVLSAVLLIIALLVVGCGGNNSASNNSSKSESGAANSSTNAGSEAAEKVVLKDITQVVNWFPQPEHGGQYAAMEKGFYEEAGMNMTILPGGPQVSSMQIVASGKAQFGLGIADDILQARENGLPLVAVASVFQESPSAIMVHKDAGINTLADLEGHKLFLAAGSNFWAFIKNKYDYKDVQEQAYTGSLVEFVNDPTSGIQSFATSEPYVMYTQGVDIDLRMISESGYNPYMNLIFTTEKFIEENPETVKAFVEASLKGWDYYKENYEEINPVLQAGNPDVPLENMKATAEAAMDFIYTGDALEHGLGYMSLERWQELADQLSEVGLLDANTDVTKAFTTEFLPQ